MPLSCMVGRQCSGYQSAQSGQVGFATAAKMDCLKPIGMKGGLEAKLLVDAKQSRAGLDPTRAPRLGAGDLHRTPPLDHENPGSPEHTLRRDRRFSEKAHAVAAAS